MELNSKTKEKIEDNTPVDQATEELKQRIEESKANLAEQMPEPKKSGRGRKPGSLNKKTIEAQKPAETAQSASVHAPPDISPYLAGPLRMLSVVPARNHGIPELALTEDEALLCAQTLNACLQAFVPDISAMSPKTAAVMSLVTVFGSIGVTKYQIYLEHKSKREPIMPEPEKQERIAKVQEDAGVAAGEYFRQ
jgi:hypothetical protein